MKTKYILIVSVMILINAIVYSQDYIEMTKLVASDRAADDRFGTTVCISGNYTIVGVRNEDQDVSGENTLEYAGSAYIFKRDESGIWNEVQKIVASDRETGVRFGTSVSISGNYTIIGAVNKDEVTTGGDTLTNAGSAYIFESCSQNPVNDPENIIENGDFETCILSPWSLYTADWLGIAADAVIVNGKSVLTPFSIADEPQSWHIQMNQLLTANQLALLEVGATYELSFDAFAEVDNRPSIVYFGQDGDPWQIQLIEEIWINKETETYTFDFTLEEIYANMRLTFELGTETTWAAFDNVSLVNKTTSGVYELSDKNDIKLVPNPAADQLKVYAEEGSKVSIYNSLGKLVKTGVTENGLTVFQTDELELGIYIIRVQKENEVFSGKILVR
ncbi:hypothetical protein ES708_03792 [subsurface metagenome]